MPRSNRQPRRKATAFSINDLSLYFLIRGIGIATLIIDRDCRKVLGPLRPRLVLQKGQAVLAGFLGG